MMILTGSLAARADDSLSRVGAGTVVTSSAATAPVVAKGESGGTGKAPPAFPDVTLISPRPPTDAELAGDSVYRFIVHHATTHFPKSQAIGGSLARWRGGRPETVCPITIGLDPAYNAFVTARLRAVAQAVGAPVNADPRCQDNVRILFTTTPDKIMGSVLKWAGNRWASGIRIRRSASWKPVPCTPFRGGMSPRAAAKAS
jgi:hypothetical protein